LDLNKNICIAAPADDLLSEDHSVTRPHTGTPLTFDQSDFKGRTVSSGLITISAQVVQFVLNLLAVACLARLLRPEDFGLVAMVTSVSNFLVIFNDAGLSTATVQREGITQAQVSNLFWTNVALGGSICLLLAASAPVIAWFFREPRLTGITLAISTTFLLTTASVQHLAVLKRQMRFKRIALVQIASALAGVLAGIGLAWFKFGYWAPVGMQVCNTFAMLVLAWLMSGWRPGLPKGGVGTRSLLAFGANLTASTFLLSMARGSDSVFIGRIYGAGPLGVYSRGTALVTRPIEHFVSPVSAVLVPALSRLQPDPDRYRRVALQLLEAVAVFSFLVAGLFLALADPITRVVLGPGWPGAAAIFAGLSFVWLYTPAYSITTELIVSQGRGRDFLVLSVIVSSLVLVSIAAGLPFGPVGVAISYSGFCLLLSLPLAYYIAGRRGPVRARDLWIRFLSHAPVWIVVCAAASLSRRIVWDSAPIVQLFFSGCAGLASGMIFIACYNPSRRAVLNFRDVLVSLKRRTA
jgi:PST family polysaccharide transporter